MGGPAPAKDGRGPAPPAVRLRPALQARLLPAPARFVLDPWLAVAAFAPLALLLPLPFPLGLAVAVAAGAWAPGWCLLRAVYPGGRLDGLERHALAAGLGLVLLPVEGLLASATLGFNRVAVALAIFALSATCTAVAVTRRAPLPAPAPTLRAPSTPVTLGLCAAALLAAGALWFWPSPAAGTPPALWLEDGAGNALALPASWPAHAPLNATVLVAAGDAPLDGTLAVWWGSGDGAPLLTQEVHLAPSGRLTLPLRLDTAPGPHTLAARLSGGVEREVHLTLLVG